MLKHLADRRSRFEERVRVERLFLAPVNKFFSCSAPLAGMTAAAIDSWDSRAKLVWGIEFVDSIATILREASARAELLADNSRDVFEKESRGSKDGLEGLADLLHMKLSSFDSNPSSSLIRAY